VCISSSTLPVLRASPWRMGPIGSPETSVRNYHYSRNSPVKSAFLTVRVFI
jgi:hypothetical protein